MRKMIEEERARALLLRNGLDVSPEQAAEILIFLQKLSDLIVSQFLRERSPIVDHAE
jgi:hypothetical protein